MHNENSENEERVSPQLSGDENSNAVLFPRPLLVLQDATNHEICQVCPKDFVSLEGFPKVGSVLGPFAAEYHLETLHIAQDKTKRAKKIGFLGKSGGLRVNLLNAAAPFDNSCASYASCGLRNQSERNSGVTTVVSRE